MCVSGIYNDEINETITIINVLRLVLTALGIVDMMDQMQFVIDFKMFIHSKIRRTADQWSLIFFFCKSLTFLDVHTSNLR